MLGSRVGALDGLEDRLPVCWTGLFDGKAVGLSVAGLELGDFDGLVVTGLRIGAFEGFADGLFICWTGLFDGKAVGL